MEKILNNLKDKIKEGFKLALRAFADTLWGFIKEEVENTVQELSVLLEGFLASSEGKKKKKEVVNIILEKINLPLPLKPFKWLIRKVLSDKIEEVVFNALEKTKEFFA